MRDTPRTPPFQRKDGGHAKRRPDETRLLRTLVVRRAARLPGEGGPMGHVKAGPLTLACALGRRGVTHAKREGDKATPAGAMRVLYGYYRSDRICRPACRIPLSPMPPNLGWCDDPMSALYNRPAALPMRPAHEDMRRNDGLYDVVFVLDYNIDPRRSGRGSAIFLHCAKPFKRTPGTIGPSTTRPSATGPSATGPNEAEPAAARSGLSPTLGCVALRPEDMRRLLGRLARNPRLIVV